MGDTIGDEKMKDLHPIFSQLKNEFPKVYEKHMQLGREIHMESGPLDEKTRWLIKIAISAATGHTRALETHLAKAQAAGVTDEQISHALLLLVPSCGFPAFMEAYSTSKGE